MKNYQEGRKEQTEKGRTDGLARGRTKDERDEAKVDRALEDVRRRVCDLWRSARIAILRGKMTLLRYTVSHGYSLKGNVAAALDRTQGPNKIDRTFCLLCTCLAAVPVLGWLKGRCRLP